MPLIRDLVPEYDGLFLNGVFDSTSLFPGEMAVEIGYGIECDCPWEPEHQCCILIRNDKVVYVGPSESLDPWGDEADYYCIWNDKDDE